MVMGARGRLFFLVAPLFLGKWELRFCVRFEERISCETLVLESGRVNNLGKCNRIVGAALRENSRLVVIV